MFILMVPPDDSGSGEKAKLDSEKIDTAIPKGSQKVELDLDDSPFLEEEEEEEETAPPASVTVDDIPLSVEPPKTSRKKLIIVLGGGVVLLLIVGLVLFFTLRKKSKPAPPPEPPAAHETAPVPQQPKEPPVAPPEEKIVSMEPFVVEFGEKDKTRFLTCRFAIVTANQELITELNAKMLIIRDGIYYFLKNKSLTFLSDKSNADSLKKSLLTVINQYLSSGRVETIWIEDYLVK